jgi:DNA-binding sugar fermentation-stimulating protein
MCLTKLKPKDIKPLREKILLEQSGCCAICHEAVMPDEAVLDHCHKTGYIRAVLHRGCNAYIGHMENNLARNKITPARLQAIMINFLIYINSHRLYVHPSHLTADEKKARLKRRAKKRRAKT